jgi:hypothetical protein
MKELTQDEVVAELVGNYITGATEDTITLSSGAVLQFDTEADCCCSYIELTSLASSTSLISSAKFEDNEDETGGEGKYKAWIHVITAADELNIAEADGDASNGYYLHGFALPIRLVQPAAPEPDQAEVEAAIQSIRGACRHGIPLLSTIGGPSTYCKDCNDAFTTNPRYYADNLHLGDA